MGRVRQPRFQDYEMITLENQLSLRMNRFMTDTENLLKQLTILLKKVTSSLVTAFDTFIKWCYLLWQGVKQYSWIDAITAISHTKRLKRCSTAIPMHLLSRKFWKGYSQQSPLIKYSGSIAIHR